MIKDIPGWGGIYQIDTCGNVYSKHKKTIAKLKLPVYKGYRRICLCLNGRRERFMVHRLVLMTFLDDFNPTLQINHINGIKDDNRLENLEMVTPGQNIVHGSQLGLCKGSKGEKHPRSKLTDNQVIQIKGLIESGLSSKDIAAIYNVPSALISWIKRGKDGSTFNAR